MYAPVPNYLMKINVVRQIIPASGKMKLAFNLIVEIWIIQMTALAYLTLINARGITKHRYVKHLPSVLTTNILMANYVSKLETVMREIKTLMVHTLVL